MKNFDTNTRSWWETKIKAEKGPDARLTDNYIQKVTCEFFSAQNQAIINGFRAMLG